MMLKAAIKWLFYGNTGSDHLQSRLSGKPAQEVFETIYREKMWGGRGRPGFHSGSGSRDANVVAPYVTAVRSYISSLGGAPTVVDIGCGDFHVGSKLVDAAHQYIACDIARPLIENNRRKFASLPGLVFRVLDCIDDPLPAGDIVLVRQVLQHLNNAQVAAVLPKLAKFKAAVITEHIPSGAFTPNLDKPTGIDTRMRDGSGLVLDAAPFYFKFRAHKILCEVADQGGLIRSTAFVF